MRKIHSLLRNPAIPVLWLFILSGINAAHAQLWVDPAQAGQSFKVVDIRFFESGYDTVPMDQRGYYTSFSRSSARYIYGEVYVENRLYNREDNPVKLDYKYYSPDGSLFGETSYEHTIPYTDEWYYIWQGWGWSDAGNWEPGRYRLEVWYAGKKVGENYFDITGDGTDYYSGGEQNYTLLDINFFEAGEDVPDDHIFNTVFSKNSARYIYTEVGLDNHLWNVRDNPVNFTLKYYHPDGSEFGVVDVPYTIPMSWEIGEIWDGWGWAEAGWWDAGRYRVEVWNGASKLGENYFEITASTDPPNYSTTGSQTVSLTQIRFFEGGENIDSGRIYNTSFAKSSARYIYTEVTLDNHWYNVQDNPVSLVLKYYKEDGSLFGEPVHSYTIPMSWDVAELWKGWGWADAGWWDTGRYRVEIWNAGVQLGVNYFNIY
jgi:hypothetical protein